MAKTVFSPSDKERIWEKYYGKNLKAIDVFGRPMKKSNFEVDHIYPFHKGGSTTVQNGMPLARLSNEEKSDKLNGVINGHMFEVEGLFANGSGKLYVDLKCVTLKWE